MFDYLSSAFRRTLIVLVKTLELGEEIEDSLNHLDKALYKP